MLFIKIIILLFSLQSVEAFAGGSLFNDGLVFSQLPEDKLEEVIKKRFGSNPQDPAFTLPFIMPKEKAELHSLLPSLSFEELIRMQVKSREFRWVNRGDVIGVELNEDFFTDLKKKKDASRKKQGSTESSYNFVPITKIPKNMVESLHKGKVTLTYSFPERVESHATKAFAAPFREQMQQALANIPYIDFVYIDEKKEGVKAAIRIVQLNQGSMVDEDGESVGYTEYDRPIREPLLICLSPHQSSGEMMDTFLHEMMHALGLPHHWEAKPVKKSGKSTHSKEVAKDLLAYKEEMFTTYAQTLPDCCNEAYTNVRPIENQNIRAVSGAILSVLYHLEDPYPKGLTVSFNPKQGEKFYKTQTQQQKDGSTLIDYSGRLSGITISNPGLDSTDLDFRNVSAFHTPPSGYLMKKEWNYTVYPKGVTAFLGPDANITFNTYMPQNQPWDKNVSIDLFTKIKRVYLSPHEDWTIVSDLYKNAEVYPGAGNDLIQLNAKTQKVVIDQNEGQDIILLPKGGNISLGYKQKDLNYFKKGNDLYLLTLGRKNSSAQGICLRNINDKKNIVIQDASGEIIDLSAQDFIELPDTIKFVHN